MIKEGIRGVVVVIIRIIIEVDRRVEKILVIAEVNRGRKVNELMVIVILIMFLNRKIHRIKARIAPKIIIIIKINKIKIYIVVSLEIILNRIDYYKK